MSLVAVPLLGLVRLGKNVRKIIPLKEAFGYTRSIINQIEGKSE